MRKYILYRLYGDTMSAQSSPELITEERGMNIQHVAEDLISDIQVDIGRYEELRAFPTFAYMPRPMEDPKYKEEFDYSMTGIVSPPSLPTVIHIEYGIKEILCEEANA